MFFHEKIYLCTTVNPHNHMAVQLNDILRLPAGEQFAVDVDVPVSFTPGEVLKPDNLTTLFVKHGKMSVEVDFREFNVSEGHTLGLFNGQYFTCKEATGGLTVSYITFSRELMHEVAAPFPPSFFAFFAEYPMSPDMAEEDVKRIRMALLMALHIYLNRSHSFRHAIFKNLLQTCLMDLYDKTKAQFINRRRQNTSRQEELLERFVHLLFQHGGRQREVKYYADRLCISTRYLSSVVQALTGYTPKTLIDERCVQEIKMMLRTTDDTMQEIAFKLGFPDQSFFTRYFKKHTGVIPAEYRRSGKVKG